MIPQPAKQQPNVEGEHSRESGAGPTSEGSLHTCIANIGKLVIAVALDLVPNGSGRQRMVGEVSSHPDHPSALAERMSPAGNAACTQLDLRSPARHPPGSPSATQAQHAPAASWSARRSRTRCTCSAGPRTTQVRSKKTRWASSRPPRTAASLKSAYSHIGHDVCDGSWARHSPTPWQMSCSGSATWPRMQE